MHAAVTVEVDNAVNLNLNNTSATIVIERPNGEKVAEGNMRLNLQADDLGLKQPGPQQITLVMEPLGTNPTLVENETVKGTVDLRLADKQFARVLPETGVVFTH